MSTSIQEPEQANNLPKLEQNIDNENSQLAIKSQDNINKISTKKVTTIILNIMWNFFRDLIIIIFVAITYAALTNDTPPKISKCPSAYPFFAKDSIVTDWYRGEITRGIEQARSSDIAFVMFYAPWDAQSQHVRHEFELAAKYMHRQVSFAAVNCWQPGSECKHQYSKVYNWPVLIAYPTHGRGIQYNGPLTAIHMIKFLQNICRPLKRTEEANILLAEHDASIAVVLGIVDTLPGSIDYKMFYLTALRCLEKDPFRDISFAVISKPKDDNNLMPKRQLLLYMWNETLIYPSNGEWTPDLLLTWIFKKSHQITGWLNPTGTKSLMLSSCLQPGPALILFTPKNPLLNQIDYYSLLREIGYEYYNCDNNNRITLRANLIHNIRVLNYDKYNEMKLKCSLKHKELLSNTRNIVTHLPKIWANNSLKTVFKNDDLIETCGNCFDFNLNGCERNKFQKYKISMLNDFDDFRSPSNLIKLKFDEDCKNLFNSEKFQSPTFERNFNNYNLNLTGLACKTNHSLSLIALDSLQYYHFAEKLGINLFKTRDKTAVVIVNDKMETHHIMSGPFNNKNLRRFIVNFTDNSLERALHSNPHLNSKSTHTFPQINNEINGKFYVNELNSENFLSTILQENKAVIVFYYSKQCGICSGISYKFLVTAKLLAFVQQIEFTRIDGDLNLLPWEYTMETFPTILFIPKIRKSESRVFPKTIAITVPNLIGFILTNLEPTMKLHAMWSICNQTKFKDEKTSCITSVRAETLSIIERTLKEWRSVSIRQKADILYKLQLLKHLHLLFAHSPQKVPLIQNYLNKLNYYKSNNNNLSELSENIEVYNKTTSKQEL